MIKIYLFESIVEKNVHFFTSQHSVTAFDEMQIAIENEIEIQSKWFVDFVVIFVFSSPSNQNQGAD